VLVAALALVLGAAGAVAPWPTLAAAVVALGALARHLGRAVWLAAVVCAGVGAGRAQLALAAHERAHAAALQLLPAPSRCAASARVTSSPVRRGGRWSFQAELSGLDCEGRLDEGLWRARLHLPASPGSWFARGDEVAVVGDLAPTSELRNFLLPDPRPGAARRGAVLSGAALSVEVTRRAGGPRALIDRARAHVRERIDASFGASVTGMARALVLGENDLERADELAFERSGLSHLLAVSGTHLIVAVLALVRALEAVLRRSAWLAACRDVRRPAALVGMVLALLYADFAGGSGSAWRAAWMLCAALGVRAVGRHALPSRVLAASLGAGASSDALAVFDPGFSLSVAATAGLLAAGRRLEARGQSGAAMLAAPRAHDLARLVAAVTRASLTTFAATLPCVPVLLSMSPGLSLASVAANLLAAPLGEAVALPLCLLHALCWPWPALERGVALVASGALLTIRGVARAAASVSWLYFEVPPPGPWHLACLVGGGGLVFAACGRPWFGSSRSQVFTNRLRAALGGLALTGLGLLLAEAGSRWPHSAACSRVQQRLRITALDVGQGDAALVDLPDGRLMLVDGGGMVGVPVDPGERVILPTLRARRRERLDVVVLTHPHPDHFGGLGSVLRDVEVGELWYGGPPQAGLSPERSTAAPSAYERLLGLAREKHISLRSAPELCGRASPLGTAAGAAAAVAVLHPCPHPVGSASANDNSLVLRIRHGQHAALLVGDAERWAEQRLLGTPGAELAADFLKVGHHGSRSSSSPEFIERVAPRYAAISCGVRNRFGHPHPETLVTLRRYGVAVLGLDRLGAVEWQSDGARQAVRSFVSPIDVMDG
jgi:competence protein ComEC